MDKAKVRLRSGLSVLGDGVNLRVQGTVYVVRRPNYFGILWLKWGFECGRTYGRGLAVSPFLPFLWP